MRYLGVHTENKAAGLEQREVNMPRFRLPNETGGLLRQVNTPIGSQPNTHIPGTARAETTVVKAHAHAQTHTQTSTKTHFFFPPFRLKRFTGLIKNSPLSQCRTEQSPDNSPPSGDGWQDIGYTHAHAHARTHRRTHTHRRTQDTKGH